MTELKQWVQSAVMIILETTFFISISSQSISMAIALILIIINGSIIIRSTKTSKLYLFTELWFSMRMNKYNGVPFILIRKSNVMAECDGILLLLLYCYPLIWQKWKCAYRFVYGETFSYVCGLILYMNKHPFSNCPWNCLRQFERQSSLNKYRFYWFHSGRMNWVKLK